MEKRRLTDEGKKLPSCENPTRIGETLVVCRKCEACKKNRVTQFAGRVYADALKSDSFVALTLTYNDSRAGAASWLDYRDIQLMLKRLRRRGYNVRYVVAGEYGSKRGRAHWHLVLMFRGEAPPLPPAETEKQHWEFWRHGPRGREEPLGYVYVQRPDYHGLLYVLKYAVKDDGTDATTRRVMMSKRPALGYEYWPELARQRIEAGLPFARTYTLDGATFANGNAVRFYLTRASLRDAYLAHVSEWRREPSRRGTIPPIRTDDKEAVLKALLPSDFETRATMAAKDYPDGFKKRRTKPLSWREYEPPEKRKGTHVEMFRLPSGVIIAQRVDTAARERGPLWLVEGIAELARLVRGRAVKIPDRTPQGVAPF